MKKQNIAIFLTLVICATAVVLVPIDKDVEASIVGGGPVGLDYNFIENVADDLSDFVFNVQTDGMDKGRAFGTEGENDSAGDIKDWMEGDCDLDSIGTVKFDPIKNRLYRGKSFYREYSLNKKLKVKSKSLTIYDGSTYKDVDDTEFYISPTWEKASFPFYKPIREIYAYTGLSKTFSGNDLKVKHFDIYDSSKIKNMIENENGDFISNVTNEINETDGDLYKAVLYEFEVYFHFDFTLLGPDEEGWPDCYKEINCDSPYVMLKLDNTQNPLRTPEEWEKLLKNLKRGHLIPIIKNRLLNFHKKIDSNCKGILLYDFNDDTYDMNYDLNYPYPRIYINGSKGTQIYNNINNHRINFSINQNWEKVDSKNVIGKIEGKDKDKTVILSCLYDGWWNQASADSAIGMGMVLSIAKYMKHLYENNTKPKYNVEFIAFSGEEYGLKGARYHQRNHSYEKIITVIDLNQLGFDQPPSAVAKYDEDKINLTLQTWTQTRKNDVHEDIKDIIKWTNYDGDLLQKNIKRSPILPVLSSPFGNYYPFTLFHKYWNSKTYKYERPDTIFFVKNGNWTYHHRDGKNHDEGDTMDHYNTNDVKQTVDLIWNITKYFTINPNCLFDGEPTFETSDSNSDGNDDTVSVTFTVDSIMPNDKIRVLLRLSPTSEEDKKFDPPSGSPTPNFNLGDTYSYDYFPWVNIAQSVNPQISRKQEEVIPEISGCWEDGEGPPPQWDDKYYVIDKTGVTDTLSMTLPSYMPASKYKVEFLIYNSSGIIDGKPQDSRETLTNKLTPPNILPQNKPPQQVGNAVPPSDDNYGNILNPGSISLLLNASDNDSDDIEFQASFINNTGVKQYSEWTKPLTQGVEHTKKFYWTIPDVENVTIRMRDTKRSPNHISNWSNPINITLNTSCHAKITPIVEVLNDSLDFKGLQYNISNISSWYWNFNDGTNSSNQNTSHSYSQTGNYQVSLTVTDSENNNYTYNTTITILYIKSDFNMSDDSVKTNETITFTNITKSYYGNVTNLTWNFGDGTIIYDNNTPTHNYSTEGIYTVSLTVKDDHNNTHTYNQTVYVDSTSPNILREPAPSGKIGLGTPVKIYADLFDNVSNVSTIKVNIIYPDDTSGNYTMSKNDSHPYDYEYFFTDTWQIGHYLYHFWVVDNANNTNLSRYRSFTISSFFGNSDTGSKHQDVNDRISGSVFTMYENGTAERITAHIQTNLSTPPKTKCMVYRANDSTLVGTTEEKTPNTGDDPEWIIFNFTGTKPTLNSNAEYILVCWSNDTCNLSYQDSELNTGRYKNETYGSPPNTLSSANETREYCIYLNYSTKPIINNVTITNNSIGIGGNLTISANISHNTSGIYQAFTEIVYPDNTNYSYIMNNTENDTYQLLFDDTWKVGQYNYTIKAYDRLGRNNSSATYNFTISANVSIKICTLYDNYSGNTSVNITDPPTSSNNPEFNANNIVERGDTWNKYYDSNTDEYQLAIYPSVVNYKNETDIFNPINTTIISKSLTISGQQYQYGVDCGIYEAYWKEQSSDTKLKPLTMVYDKYTVTMSPQDYITFNPHKTGNQGMIGNRVQSDAETNSNSIKYPGQYQCIGSSDDFADLEYEYQPLRVKENLVIFNQSYLRDRFDTLCDPSDGEIVNLTFSTIIRAYNTSDIDSNTLGIVYGDSRTSFKEYGMVGGDDINTDEEIYFTDDQNTTVFFIPKLYATDSNGSSILLSKTVSMTDFGNLRVDVLTPWSWLNSSERVYPVFIDPSVQYDADTGDGWAREGPDTWSVVRNGSGSYSSDDDNSEYGVRIQKLILDSDYYISRAFFSFNTSGLPNNSVITSASVNIRGCFIKSPPFVVSSGVVFQKWTGGGTVSNGDYNDFSGSMYGSLGSWSTTGWNTIPWRYNKDEISKTSDTDICVRNWEYDYNDSAPSPESGDWGSPMFFADSSYDPYLSISYQYPPAISNETPANNTRGVPLYPTVSVTVTDTDNSTMNITWYNKIDGTWHVFGTNNSVLNGTYSQNFSNASVNGQWWYWKVNVTDNVSSKESAVFQFYTGNQSKLSNDKHDSKDISGYLLFNVSFYNETSQEWVFDHDILWSYVTINASYELGLDTIFNGNFSTIQLSYGNGTYRLTVALVDPNWNVLVCDDQTKIEATYEFEVTY